MPSITEFLIERLENTGIKHVFGVPGDYILNFFGKLEHNKKIKLITNADESNAGFAADAYARTNGIGCVAVTYNVGALKLCNPVAGAFAEKSPIIVISGAPGAKEKNEMPMHHMIGSFDCQREVFKSITCAQAILDNPTTAGYEIDRVLEVLKYYKQPVYIELPRDMWNTPINYDVYTVGTPKLPETDFQNLEDVLKEVVSWIEEANNPVLLAGVEIARCKLGKELIGFIERHNIPVASTLLSKSVVPENHPLYVGVYAGSNSSQQRVIELVENSDCLLVCGEVITEATVGYRPSKAFQKRDMVTCTINGLRVKNHNYPNVSFNDFCSTLFKTNLTKREPLAKRESSVSRFIPEAKFLTTERFFEKINSAIWHAKEELVVIADVGDAMMGASDLLEMKKSNTFYAPAFYLSMGFAIPAALGVMLAQNIRPIVIVGDGSFQMSCLEISTILKHNLNPIIMVLNNRGYSTERVILDGSFNDIMDWDYEKVTTLMRFGKGFRVEGEVELEEAFEEALKSKEACVLNCVVESTDISPALTRICKGLAKKAKGGS